MHLFLSRRVVLLLLLLVALVGYSAIHLHELLVLPVLLLALGVAYFFRSPSRRVPAEPLGVIAPVDAVVTAVERITEGELVGGWQVTLHSRAGGPYVVRSPMEGKVCDLLWSGGRGRGPQGTRMVIESDERDRIQMSIVPRFPRLHGHCSIHPGERVGQGGVCGFVPFGGRFAVFLPEACRVLVNQGERVRAGSDVLAKLIRP